MGKKRTSGRWKRVHRGGVPGWRLPLAMAEEHRRPAPKRRKREEGPLPPDPICRDCSRFLAHEDPPPGWNPGDRESWGWCELNDARQFAFGRCCSFEPLS